MIIKKNLLFILSFFFVTAFSQQRKQPVNLLVKEDYTHSFTKTIFPLLWSGFQREEVVSYDLQNQNVAVSYVQQKTKKIKTVLTLYIYPKKEIDNQLLRDEFYSYQYAINQNSNKGVDLKPSFGSISNENLKVNYIYSIFNNTLGQRDFFKGVKYVDKKSLLSIYECGGWGFKIRVSSDDMTEDQLKGLKEKAENYFGILNIASIKPLPIQGVPNTVLSPSIKRDSMMVNATIAASEAKIEWIKNHLDKKELLTGFSDMQIDSEVYATEKMIEFYKANQKNWKLHGDTQKYFSEMIRIAENGKIKDHIYEKFHKIINYPEGEAQQGNYTQFKIDKDVSEDTNEIFYKIFYKLD
ncbi:hypothetical protein [Chryseobacterium polytrichastri]|uniref:Uncharacterized protein n=1 Tax=Chryseobacterium polytrichastri TaxID=1302687 RepID=A0A1M7GAU3_9FLAO|nr:hypothetical protein [Chryseobacterium polytrichastri]SHM13494.1 hypothetical protein SAMN05444267_103545 [Chryseobacterium polytrichastri]